ncbi:unnamed protein product [marine sediment metagenome]|uniref:Nuclease associated modular domain-containing protein n=1 Tax=marine sediment metagenome TaxID=412755 RepID=X0ZB87_9ZZZZ
MRIGQKHTKEAKRKIGEAHRGKPPGMLGKNQTREARLKISKNNFWFTASPEKIEQAKESLRKRARKDNPMFKAETRKKVSEKIEELYKNGKLIPRKRTLMGKLKRKIRRLPQYKEWKEGVLKRDVPTYPVIPVGLQVHHHKKTFTAILKENNIKTVEEAIRCRELWDIKLGQVVPKGDHYIISQLEKRVNVSKELLNFLEAFIKIHRAKEIE